MKAIAKRIFSTVLFLWLALLIGMMVFSQDTSQRGVALPICLLPSLLFVVVWAFHDFPGLISGPIGIWKGIVRITDVVSGNNIICPKCGHSNPRSAENCKNCKFRLEKLAELSVLDRISYLLNDASPTDRAVWVNVWSLLSERNQVGLAIDKARGEIQSARESIGHWRNASDSDSSRMGVYWGERRAEDAKKKMSELQAKLPVLDAKLKQLRARLESSVSKSTDEFYAARAEEILTRL